jgi:hypothetical protein
VGRASCVRAHLTARLIPCGEHGVPAMKRQLVIAVMLLLTGCSIERAVVARNAQDKMVGLSKEQVLACMGPPIQKAAEGSTEVWSYNSGNDHTTAIGTSFGSAQASATGGPGYAYANSSGQSTSIATSSRRYCTVNIVMADNRVSQVNYSGPTGGLLTAGEQCAFAVQNCSQ